jgi:glycine/D-amino acid oxidase-like deaminating enzyme
MIGASSGKRLSYWIDTTPRTDYPALPGDVSADVAVLGGGIVGLTAAVLLKRLGKTVAVIESRRVAEGVTGHTTAKVTSQHRLIYDTLIKDHGERKARLYGEANEAAIERIAAFVGEKKIECDLLRLPAYVYTESEAFLPRIEAEARAASRLGLPASFVREVPLPFPVKGALRFEDQIQFHIRKYLLPLAEEIPGSGSYVFENTRAMRVREGVQCRVETDRGRVIAKDVIIASPTRSGSTVSRRGSAQRQPPKACSSTLSHPRAPSALLPATERMSSSWSARATNPAKSRIHSGATGASKSGLAHASA